MAEYCTCLESGPITISSLIIIVYRQGFIWSTALRQCWKGTSIIFCHACPSPTFFSTVCPTSDKNKNIIDIKLRKTRTGRHVHPPCSLRNSTLIVQMPNGHIQLKGVLGSLWTFIIDSSSWRLPESESGGCQLGILEEFFLEAQNKMALEQSIYWVLG